MNLQQQIIKVLSQVYKLIGTYYYNVAAIAHGKIGIDS